MKQLLNKILLFLSSVSLLFILILSQADGYTDPFYLRFTSPKQHSLIIGTSRAAQGIVPSILNEKLNTNFYNYAFTLNSSPFGTVYLNSIKQKLDTNYKKGKFIITVCPWSIATYNTNLNQPEQFRETKWHLANTTNVTYNPNIEYLLKNLKGSYFKILLNKIYTPNLFLHDDGWLEVSVNMDTAMVKDRIKRKMKTYAENKLHYITFSPLRLKSLNNTIDYLKDYGTVYLVRLPVHEKMMQIEQQLMPDFDTKIKDAISTSSGYLDLTKHNKTFDYVDGNHIFKESAKNVSTQIANWIIEQEQFSLK